MFMNETEYAEQYAPSLPSLAMHIRRILTHLFVEKGRSLMHFQLTTQDGGKRSLREDSDDEMAGPDPFRNETVLGEGNEAYRVYDQLGDVPTAGAGMQGSGLPVGFEQEQAFSRSASGSLQRARRLRCRVGEIAAAFHILFGNLKKGLNVRGEITSIFYQKLEV